jgi:hypothetical protein
MTTLRRFIVIQALMLWQGGFLFYAAFVVPTGAKVLGGAFEQGRITQFVADTMNWVGLAAIVVFAWELLHAPPRPGSLKRLLWITWLVMAAGLASLFSIRLQLLELVDFEDSTFPDRRLFHFWHRIYLWISTLQWAAGLIFVMALVYSWRRSDALNSYIIGDDRPS